MLDAWLAAVPVGEVLVRMVATALVIIVVSWSVQLLGPLIGGVLAGLPITMGPGFYFLIAQAPAPFVSQAAAYTILSLCATQSFLLAYIVIARRGTPWAALLAALAAWSGLALLLRLLPSPLWLGTLMFALTTWACLRLGRASVRPVGAVQGSAGLGLLLLRGLLAGILVAGVTTASHWLGAAATGLLLSFPIGYSVISVTLHQRLGRDTAIATLYSALLGGTSLAAFCIALSIVVMWVPGHAALMVALSASLVVTSTLALWRVRHH